MASGRFYAPTPQRAVLLDGEINEQRPKRLDNLRDTRSDMIVKPHIFMNWNWTECQAAFVVILFIPSLYQGTKCLRIIMMFRGVNFDLGWPQPSNDGQCR